MFFLTTEFLSFSIQDNNKQDFQREKRSRVILACWLAGLSCKPTPFKSKRKVLIGTLTLEVRKHSELQLLCRYNSCKAVANNGEG